jgi:hypothetical protein
VELSTLGRFGRSTRSWASLCAKSAGRPRFSIGVSNSEDDYDNIDGDHRTQGEVWDDELIVSLPGTIYAVTYYKPASSPSLLAKNFPSQDDSRADLTQAEFLSRAWHLANTKARELGWLA